MKKFMVMYMAPVAEMQKMMQAAPEQAKEGMKEWQKWMSDNKEHFADMGGSLGKIKRVTADGATDMRNDMAGYSIIMAETQDEATALFTKDQPHFQIPGGYVEIMEIVAMPSA